MSNIIAKIFVGLFIASVLALGYLYNANQSLKQEVSDKTVNLKAMERGLIQYKDRDSVTWSRVVELRKTNAELKQSTDSQIVTLNKYLAAAGIAIKNVKGISITNTELVRDTIFMTTNKTPNAVYDFSKPPYIKNIVTVKNDTVRNQLKITDEVTSVTTVRKETVDPPKKFFLWRWFQEKHLVVSTDIRHSNKDIDVKSATQIQVLNNDGTPKKDR